MRVSKFMQFAGVAAVAILSQACTSGNPVRPVQDKTPSWLKYEVTGSRIRRPAGVNGQAESASFVTRTNADGLAMLPAISFIPGR